MSLIFLIDFLTLTHRTPPYYRGISLLPTAYKLYEKILKDKLQPIAENILVESTVASVKADQRQMPFSQ
jgi:hypothetical protein